MKEIKTSYADDLEHLVFPRQHQGKGQLKYIKAWYDTPGFRKLTKGHRYVK